MKWLNAKVFMIVETLIILILPISNMIFKFLDTEVLASFLIAMISLIIAHHSYFLAKGTIDSQNSFKKCEAQIECMMDLRELYKDIIIDRDIRLTEWRQYRGLVQRRYKDIDKYKQIDPYPTLCKIHALFSYDLYLNVDKYVKLLLGFLYINYNKFDNINSIIDEYSKCIELLEGVMVEETKNNLNNKVRLDEYNKHYQKLLEWKNIEIA